MEECGVPLKRGQTFQTAVGPSPENWPRASSSRKRGMPHSTNEMKYGMRKAPEVESGRGLRGGVMESERGLRSVVALMLQFGSMVVQ